MSCYLAYYLYALEAGQQEPNPNSRSGSFTYVCASRSNLPWIRDDQTFIDRDTLSNQDLNPWLLAPGLRKEVRDNLNLAYSPFHDLTLHVMLIRDYTL